MTQQLDALVLLLFLLLPVHFDNSQKQDKKNLQKVPPGPITLTILVALCAARSSSARRSAEAISSRKAYQTKFFYN